ncbi:MAG: acyl-CoA/acyl-ACP dehydrogenase [Chloroflexi bacterium]|nr:acyl-CoA/acyl-ACP dehydrogenase [Chloroflexota bacterium]
MDLSLSETQTMLQNTTKELMEKEMPKARVLEIDESPSGFAPDVWRKICELGLPGMVIPEEYGGSGNSYTDLGVVYEVLGYYACPTPHLSSAVLCANAILEAGDSSQKKALLPPIASGQQIFAFASTEPEYGWDPGLIQMQARRRNGTFVLNGTKLFVPDANVADKLIVVARTAKTQNPENGLTLFVVDRAARGVSVRVMTGWIGPKVCEINFDNVEVPASGVLGGVGRAWPAVEKAMDKATVVLSAFMAGGTQKVYEMARDYSQTRIAFGVPIGTFQRVQDRVIDALNEADATKWTTYEALWQLDGGMAEAPIGISMAKAVASVGFPKACDASHHVHGGIGTDLEMGLTQYTKRARTLQHYLGDAIYHRKRMARLMKLQG